jgi:hypothetical protein
MIAKIGRGNSLYGALAYNYQKLEKESAEVLFTQKIIQSPDGNYSLERLSRSFELYLLANRKTEKPVLHISLNPDPNDKVSNTDFENMAQDYMKQMGYGNQPFVVFKHTDIDRTHIHIVSVCVDSEGRKISDKFEKRRSMTVCRVLEKQYNLISAVEKKQDAHERIFKPVDYKAGDVKSQMASILRHLPKNYQFQTFGAYNAVLSLFNITTEQVKGEYNGVLKQGLVYFALNHQGEKTSNPFKASLFGKSAGYVQLQSQCDQNRIKLKDSPVKQSVKHRIESVLPNASNEIEFRKKLMEERINIVVRRNAGGRIYGITFIDHKSRSVWNGSELSKNLSANAFHDRWNLYNNSKSENNIEKIEDTRQHIIQPDKFNTEQSDSIFSYDFGGLFLGSSVKTEDYDEKLFANQIRKRTRGKKR